MSGRYYNILKADAKKKNKNKKIKKNKFITVKLS